MQSVHISFSLSIRERTNILLCNLARLMKELLCRWWSGQTSDLFLEINIFRFQIDSVKLDRGWMSVDVHIRSLQVSTYICYRWLTWSCSCIIIPSANARKSSWQTRIGAFQNLISVSHCWWQDTNSNRVFDMNERG